MSPIRPLPPAALATLYAPAPSTSTPSPAASHPAAPSASPSRTTAPSDGLSAAEQRTIDTYFPPRPALALRLYGADRGAQTVAPDMLGRRLDLTA